MIAAALLAGCGEGSPAGPGPDAESSKPAPAAPAVREPYTMTCRDLRTPEARSEAVEFVADVLVAPPGQKRRETAAIVRRSLKETCALPMLPNMDNPADYRPVRPVRQAVQSHLDQNAIYDD